MLGVDQERVCLLQPPVKGPGPGLGRGSAQAGRAGAGTSSWVQRGTACLLRHHPTGRSAQGSLGAGLGAGLGDGRAARNQGRGLMHGQDQHPRHPVSTATVVGPPPTHGVTLDRPCVALSLGFPILHGMQIRAGVGGEGVAGELGLEPTAVQLPKAPNPRTQSA